MTHDRETERLLDLWFADGPTVAPDRVIDVVADRIGRQRQRPGWRLEWRRHAMNTNIKIAAGIAAVLVVGLVGYALLPGRPANVGGPGPTAAPSATPTADPLPSATTQVFHPFGPPHDGLAVRIRVPVGWSTFGEWALLGPKGTGAPDGNGIAILEATKLVSDPCHPTTANPESGDEAVGPTVDDLVTALTGHRGYTASKPSPVSLDGYAGQRLDLQLPDLGSCSGDFFVLGHPDGSLYAQGSNIIWHMWILDVAGTRVIVVVDDYAGTPAADRAVAEAVVNDMVFIR